MTALTLSKKKLSKKNVEEFMGIPMTVSDIFFHVGASNKVFLNIISKVN